MQMGKPRIIREETRPIWEIEPPPTSSLRPHDWLTDESRALYMARIESKRPFNAYLSAAADAKIRSQSLTNAQARLEIMGFLLGEVSRWHGSEYSVIKDVVTTQLKSSSSKVRFDPEAFPKLFREMDASGFDYILVGWYHSHPGHTCFLSRTDLRTQRMIFDQSYHTALVIDPVNEEIKTFRLTQNSYEEAAFALFDGESLASEKGKSVRRRKLKVSPAPDV
jgi:proteasome lid subunit RPN8/RPN11